jgi:Zn-dependent M16 (insulinase) family peptidase
MTHDMIQTFRNGILEVDQKQLARVAQTYLDEPFADSSVGILAGEEIFSKAQETLSSLNTRMKRFE